MIEFINLHHGKNRYGSERCCWFMCPRESAALRKQLCLLHRVNNPAIFRNVLCRVWPKAFPFLISTIPCSNFCITLRLRHLGCDCWESGQRKPVDSLLIVFSTFLAKYLHHCQFAEPPLAAIWLGSGTHAHHLLQEASPPENERMTIAAIVTEIVSGVMGLVTIADALVVP